MTHEVLLKLAFGACMLVGGMLYLLALTAVTNEGRRGADGMVTMAVVMGLLFLYGLAGYVRMLPWS